MRMLLDDRPMPEPEWPSGVFPVSVDLLKHPVEAHALLRGAYAGGGGSVGDFDDWWDCVRLDREYDRDLCFVVATGDTGRMVAFAQCWKSNWVKDIAVAPEFR